MESLSYPVAMMRDAQANGFGSPAILPATWIVDRSGIVRAKLTPDEIKVTGQSLANAVLPWLSPKPVCRHTSWRAQSMGNRYRCVV